MLKANYKKYVLQFKLPSGTSRGILKYKEAWFISVFDTLDNSVKGIGECSIIRGLSFDDKPDYESRIKWLCNNINADKDYLFNELKDYPSINFGLETALLDLANNGKRILFPSDFTCGISSILINGLIWMGKPDFMMRQIKEKINQGFRYIKLKIGAINFIDELEILRFIRKEYREKDIEIRVDANGAFSPSDAMEKLQKLSDFNIHSIEQPIQAGLQDQMAKLCATTPIKIALDEELIGISDPKEKHQLLKTINPHYIILKPGLVGGFNSCNEWIRLAKQNNIDWWATSALESNIGLNAIAQWTFTLNNPLPQGLGTGQLFTNNIPSPIELSGENLFYNPSKKWELPF